MDEVSLPCGWRKGEHNGRIVYFTPSSFLHPSVTIHSRAELLQYQSRGRYLDVKENQLVFNRKRKQKQVNCLRTRSKLVNVLRESDVSKLTHTISDKERNDETDSGEIYNPQFTNIIDQADVESILSIDVKVSQRDIKKLQKEQQKHAEAVVKMTIDPSRNVDHQSVLEVAAQKLNKARISKIDREKLFDAEGFKDSIQSCRSVDEMTKVIWNNDYFNQTFSHLLSSRLLEQLVSLGTSHENPLKCFPVDVNRNVYADVMNFALEHAEDVMLLLTFLTKKHENPIVVQDVINLSYIFSSLAEASCPSNNALKKLKTLCLRNCGLTNAGLDSMSNVGIAQCSKSARNDINDMASITEEILKVYAKKYVAQFTFDNLDIRINDVTHHLTLNYMEFEQHDTSGLSTIAKPLEDLPTFFKKELLILNAEENVCIVCYTWQTVWKGS